MSAVTTKGPSIYTYDDYRTYLQDWYRYMKQTRRAFTHRRFAQAAGFQTSNFLLLVMQGRRRLTETSLVKVSKGLGLDTSEYAFFRNLVFFNQAKTPEERERYCNQLHQSKRYQALRPIEHWRHEYYSKWYHPVIRELVVAAQFDGTPEWLADHLYPEVTPAQCAKSIALLEHLGFIRKEGARWVQESAIISTGPRLTSTIVHHYHKTMLEMAKLLMDRLPSERRDISAITIGIRHNDYAMLQEKIREFRQELLRLTANVTAPEDVLQVCIQCFPLTR